MNKRIQVTLIIIIFIFFPSTFISLLFGGTVTDKQSEPFTGTVKLDLIKNAKDGCPDSDSSDFILFPPSGSKGVVFRIPPGQQLIIENLYWQYSHQFGARAAGMDVTLKLAAQGLTDSFTSVSVLYESTITLDDEGSGYVTEQVDDKIKISSGSRICPEIYIRGESYQSGLKSLFLRGRLVPEQEK